MGTEIQLVGRLKIKSAFRIDFIEATKKLSCLTCSMESPILYRCANDIEDQNIFLFYEIWPSRHDLDQHFQTDHFMAWRSWLDGKLQGEPEIRINAMSDCLILGS
ncbi:antibiotic biosynthesis monooxygenase [Cyanobium sp. HWJ4-Hawea]|uniref:putative quinol monooxygenase n=1 Tax=Cyanobium sp. HWJ4-Hawea TaxID=2823713 RepID=UPI0020CE8206|nr:antibiotic biosynthesis monooxygenase [Cyanobium sp. HWJ4-Hawea]MCP9810130.1 antibiotic biosynthesis monooxygenase [Cyanobium sp. HWJ4-Hawea]